MSARVVPLSRVAVEEAARLVKRGALVVFPTDTVYGLGCNPFLEDAVGRLFEAKGRGSKPVPVLCDSLGSASELVTMHMRAIELARMHWPGALTIVAPERRRVPHLLDQGEGELGVRVPAHGYCLLLVQRCGRYIAGTSANVSGRPACRTAAEACEVLGDRVDVILDGGDLRGKESTVAKVNRGNVVILRQGSVIVSQAFVP